MSDELIDTVFQNLCEDVPLLGPDAPLNATSFYSFPNAHDLAECSEAHGLNPAGTDLLPAEGSKEEAELMRILEESGLCGNPSATNLDDAYNQGFSAFTSNTAFSGPEPASDGNGYPLQVAAAPQGLSQMPDFPMPAGHHLPSTQILADCFAMADDTAPLPPISCRKRRLEDDGAGWSTSKRGRWHDASAVGRTFPPTHSTSSRFSGAYGNTEGNALDTNNFTTRTFGSEGYFPAAGSVPVSVPLSAQGLWPTMTSSAASATREHHTQMPFMAAGYSDQTVSLPFGAQPTFQQPAPMLPWGAASEMDQLFGSMQDMPTEYGFDFPQPPFGAAAAPSTTHDALLPWLPSNAMSDPFLLKGMPSMPVEESSLDAPFGQPPQFGYLSMSREPRRAHQANAVEPLSFPVAVGGPTFGAEPYRTDNQLPSVGAAATSSSSSLSTAPSTAKPKRRTQLPRASASSSSTKPSTTKPQRRIQPPRAASSKFSSTALSSAKPKKCKQPPPQTSSSSSSSKAPSSAKPKKRRPPQTPYDPNGVGCHICKGGFTKQSEVTKHRKTNKHRLNLLALLYPELKLCATQLRKNCVCPIDGCGEGLSRPWVLKRHLEDIHGVISKKVNVENVNDADGESVDDADADEEESD